MASTIGDGWRNELKKYWCKIEDQTKLSLELIKQDRIRSGLPFDDNFKNNFLRSTYTKYEFLKFIFAFTVLVDLHCILYFTAANIHDKIFVTILLLFYTQFFFMNIQNW